MSKSTLLTTKMAIKQFKKIYNDLYDYSLVNYTGVHNKLYDYSLVKYVNNNTKVKIICKIHGIFEQEPRAHKMGQGCDKCARENNYKDIPTYLYYIRVGNQWKIGVTRKRNFKNGENAVRNRYAAEFAKGLDIEILSFELFNDGAEAYNWVKYLYIDDPISSLDDNNAIAVASDLAQLLKKDKDRLKTVISSHHGLFFNVMCNELKKMPHKKYFLHRKSDSDTYTLRVTDDTPFFHHVAMLSELQQAAESGRLYTHHFNMLRSILEKTATFFGFDGFSNCIHGVEDEVLYARALNLLSHGKYSVYEPREMVDDTKDLFKKILSAFLERYRFDLPELITEQTSQARQS